MLSFAALFVTVEWIIRIGMLLYVPQKRSPAAARTWLLFIFFEPLLGFLLYLVFGRIYMPKKRIKMQRQAAERIRRATEQWKRRRDSFDPVVAADIEQTARLTRSLGELPVAGGNAVEFIDEYEEGIARLLADIDAAKHHVHLEYYIMAGDDIGERLASALERAAARGVACRVLMDYLGSRNGFSRFIPRLEPAGVEVSASLPVGLFRAKTVRFDLRNHRKLAVIDGAIGYIGSQNIVNKGYIRGVELEELVARVVGPVVAQLQVTFLADRASEREDEIPDDGLFPPVKPAGEVPAQLLPSGPGYGKASVQHLMVGLIHSARERVVITTPYFVPDDALLQALETAVYRGVSVHLIVSRQRDQFMVSFAQESFYEQLLEYGVHIHLYEPRFLHAKHMSIDDNIAIVGSSNVDIRSFALNAEITMAFYDPDVVARQRVVEQRYLQNSHELTLAEWNKRSRVRQAFQDACRLVDSFL